MKRGKRLDGRIKGRMFDERMRRRRRLDGRIRTGKRFNGRMRKKGLMEE